MTSGSSRRLPRILLWLVSAGLGVAAGILLMPIMFGGQHVRLLPWEDILTTFVGVCMLLFIPVSLLRWAFVPEARIDGMLSGALITMAVGGLALVLPVLSENRLDPAFAFGLFVVLFVGQLVIALRMNRRSDEMMRRYNSESTLISSSVLISAFSIYAAAERLGLVGAISPWGLVGIACILQYAVAMYVYYRLGMNPEAQEKPAERFRS
jgi:hypothetical protein